jgi:hypothetical protein
MLSYWNSSDPDGSADSSAAIGYLKSIDRQASCILETHTQGINPPTQPRRSSGHMRWAE